MNTGTVSQYDISFEPTRQGTTGLLPGGANATVEAVGSAWVHERVVDVTSAREAEIANMMAELESLVGGVVLVDDADTATKAVGKAALSSPAEESEL